MSQYAQLTAVGALLEGPFLFRYSVFKVVAGVLAKLKKRKQLCGFAFRILATITEFCLGLIGCMPIINWLYRVIFPLYRSCAPTKIAWKTHECPNKVHGTLFQTFSLSAKTRLSYKAIGLKLKLCYHGLIFDPWQMFRC